MESRYQGGVALRRGLDDQMPQKAQPESTNRSSWVSNSSERWSLAQKDQTPSFLFVDGLSRSVATHNAVRSYLGRRASLAKQNKREFESSTPSLASNTPSASTVSDFDDVEEIAVDRPPDSPLFLCYPKGGDDGSARKAKTQEPDISHITGLPGQTTREDTDPPATPEQVWQMVGCGNHDPFAVLAIPAKMNFNKHFHHFKYVASMDWQAGYPPPKDWIPINLSSEAALRSIVVVALAHLGAVANSAEMRTELFSECSKQKALAVRCVNENLNNPQSSMSDATILAVSSLAGAECLSSASKLHAIDVHMSGLQQIVKLRGGFSNLSFQLQRWTAMIDVRTSFSTMSPTRFSAMSTRTLRQPTAYNLTSTSSPSNYPTPCSGFLTKHALLELPLTLLNTLRELHEITALWTQCRASGPSLPASLMLSISVRELVIENALLNSPSTAPGHPLASVCRLGALIFAETVLIRVSRGANHLVAPMRALWTAAQLVRACKLDALTRNTVGGLLLSVSFLGAHIAAGHPVERAGFQARICRLSTVGRAHTWDEIEGHMKPWFYAESMHKEAFRAIWEEARTGAMMAIPHIVSTKDEENEAERDVSRQAADGRWEQQQPGPKRRKLSMPFLM